MNRIEFDKSRPLESNERPHVTTIFAFPRKLGNLSPTANTHASFCIDDHTFSSVILVTFADCEVFLLPLAHDEKKERKKLSLHSFTYVEVSSLVGDDRNVYSFINNVSLNILTFLNPLSSAQMPGLVQ